MVFLCDKNNKRWDSSKIKWVTLLETGVEHSRSNIKFSGGRILILRLIVNIFKVCPDKLSHCRQLCSRIKVFILTFTEIL